MHTSHIFTSNVSPIVTILDQQKSHFTSPKFFLRCLQSLFMKSDAQFPSILDIWCKLEHILNLTDPLKTIWLYLSVCRKLMRKWILPWWKPCQTKVPSAPDSHHMAERNCWTPQSMMMSNLTRQFLCARKCSTVIPVPQQKVELVHFPKDLQQQQSFLPSLQSF